MDFKSMNVAELRALAKEKNIKNVSAMKKQELVEALENLEGQALTENVKKEASKKDNIQKETSPKVVVAKEENDSMPPVKTAEKEVKKASDSQKETDTEKEAEATSANENVSADPHKEALSELKRAASAIDSGSDNRKPFVRNYDQPRRDQNRSYTQNRGNGESRSYYDNSRGGEGRNNDYRSSYQNRGNYQNQRTSQNYQNSQTQQTQQSQTYGTQNSQSQNNPAQNSAAQSTANQNNQVQNAQQNAQSQDNQSNAVRRGGMWVYPDETYDLHNVLTPEMAQMDSNETKTGILEIMPDGFGFIRSANFLPGDDDVYVSPAQIRRLNLKTGDMISGNTRIKSASEKFSALLYVKTVNGLHPSEAVRRPRFEDLTPVFPHDRIHLETPGCTPAMRIVDILSPIGKGQRGMIVSQPKAGKTTLLKQIATAITKNNPDMHLMILLIDERPEEVTDMKESIQGDNVEVIYSTFDELPENHKRVSEMVIGRAKRLVEHKKDVVILLDSITRLARAYNLTCTSSGRTLSGGLDPAALHMPKKFFGAARCMREGGSLTILATALVDTGSRMDDVVFEEFKGTGNMELVLDRNLSEKRIFPAIDLPKSSTRRDDLLLSPEEMEANDIIRHAFNSGKSGDAVEKIINMFAHTKDNEEFVQLVKKTKF